MNYPEDFQREVNLEYYRGGMQALRETGFAALKALITLNSGAFVVLLTFIGNTAAQSQFTVPIENLRMGMYCFLGGLVGVFCALLQAYLSARNATPYIEQSKEVLPNWATSLLSVLFPIFSFLSFIAGVIIVISNVRLA